jgi:plastocyanin
MKHEMKLLNLFSVLLLCFTYNIFSGFSADNEPYMARMSDDGIQRAEIIVDSYSFEPNHVVVEVGKPVELTLKSVTMIIPHNFSIDDPGSGLNIDQDISHGQDVTITFTPTKSGTYLFYCNKSGLFGSHRKKGMQGKIDVREFLGSN